MQHEPAFPDDKFKVAAGSPLPVRLALTPDSERPAILTGTDPVSVFLSCLEPPPLSWSPSRPVGKRATGFSVVCRLPTNPVPLPPQAVGGKILRKWPPATTFTCPPPLAGVGGERQRDGRGRLYKMAPQYFQRAPPSFTIFHSPFTIFKRPLPPLSWSPSP